MSEKKKEEKPLQYFVNLNSMIIEELNSIEGYISQELLKVAKKHKNFEHEDFNELIEALMNADPNLSKNQNKAVISFVAVENEISKRIDKVGQNITAQDKELLNKLVKDKKSDFVKLINTKEGREELVSNRIKEELLHRNNALGLLVKNNDPQKLELLTKKEKEDLSTKLLKNINFDNSLLQDILQIEDAKLTLELGSIIQNQVNTYFGKTHSNPKFAIYDEQKLSDTNNLKEFNKELNFKMQEHLDSKKPIIDFAKIVTKFKNVIFDAAEYVSNLIYKKETIENKLPKDKINDFNKNPQNEIKSDKIENKANQNTKTNSKETSNKWQEKISSENRGKSLEKQKNWESSILKESKKNSQEAGRSK